MKHIKEYNEYVDPFGEDDWDEVEPDRTFLTWLKIKYPDVSKWKDITSISCINQDLTDLIGIDKLINLRELYCYNNQLTNLNVTKNINLKQLYCFNNQLRELDVTKNINLLNLSCHHNRLSELDVTKNIKLEFLYCYSNQLKELDITKNINLQNFFDFT